MGELMPLPHTTLSFRSDDFVAEVDAGERGGSSFQSDQGCCSPRRADTRGLIRGDQAVSRRPFPFAAQGSFFH
jgi:hypothetical protein